MDPVLKEYADLSPLATRIAVHEAYSERVDGPEDDVIAHLALPSARSLLDVGCGTGSFLRRLAEGGHTGALIGLDTSPAAVGAASRIPGVQPVLGSAVSLPLDDAAVDLCTARHMLYHVPEPIVALREFGRVTRSGGRVTVVVNHARTAPRAMDWICSVAECFGADAVDNGLNDVTSDSLPDLMVDAFGDVGTVRFDNALVFSEPAPLITFAVANLSFCGVPADFPRRAEVVAAITAEAQAWFAEPGRIWRDPKGYVICTSRMSA